jgi:hypothetical protein
MKEKRRSLSKRVRRFTRRPSGAKLTVMKRIDTDSFNRRAPEMVAREEILRLAKGQQANLATRFEDLLGDGGPPDETADEMIRTTVAPKLADGRLRFLSARAEGDDQKDQTVSRPDDQGHRPYVPVRR